MINETKEVRLKHEKEITSLYEIGIIAVFTILSFLGTTIIRIPIPSSGGYFNFGDTFIMIAALLYGPKIGFFVGLVGPAISDLIGFPSFVLATGIIKSIEGLIIGLISFKANNHNTRIIIALFSGIIILVGGYFIFEAYIYTFLGKEIPFFNVTTIETAIAELIPNLLQGIFSGLLAFGIFRAFRGKKSI